MEIAEYKKMYLFEEKYWWWVGKRKIVDGILTSINMNSANILDAGCGTGFNLKVLGKYGKVTGLDFSENALKFCKMNNNKNLIQGNAVKLPFKDNIFDLITALDLLEHIDDSEALKELNRVLKKNGYLIITVPAFNFLWSKHDEALHHRIRYDKYELWRILDSRGFKIEKIGYWNFFLFFPIAAMRLLKKTKSKEIETDVKHLPDILNKFLIKVLSVENILISHLVLPFGVSIICFCKKK